MALRYLRPDFAWLNFLLRATRAPGAPVAQLHLVRRYFLLRVKIQRESQMKGIAKGVECR